MKEFMYELNRMRDEKVTAEELENAKRAIVGSFALSLEQPQALLQNIITQKLYNLPADYWDTYPQKVAAITAEDVQRVAQKYLDLGHLQVVAVGDARRRAMRWRSTERLKCTTSKASQSAHRARTKSKPRVIRLTRMMRIESVSSVFYCLVPTKTTSRWSSSNPAKVLSTGANV
jgi:hypothetical protein